MAIYRLLHNSTLEPDQISRIIKAYEQALYALSVKDRDDPLTEAIAKTIIKIAQTGDYDVAQLAVLAIAELGPGKAVCWRPPQGVKPRSNSMIPHIPEEFSTRLIDWNSFVIMGNATPPRDPEEDEADEDEEEEDRTDQPPVVREPDEE